MTGWLFTAASLLLIVVALCKPPLPLGPGLLLIVANLLMFAIAVVRILHSF